MKGQNWTIGDCLELLPSIEDKSIDMILTDLPYGTTACKWDTIIPFEPLWDQYKRIIKDNGAIVLTASQPFTSALVMSNPKMYKQSLVWEKTRPTNVFNAKKMFMKWHEDILVFYKKPPTYNPIMRKGEAYSKIQHLQDRSKGHMGKTGEKEGYVYNNNGLFYPKTIIKYATEMHKSIHPTQKPIALAEYLIKTYTNEGDTVHDSCMGSGWSLHACRNLNRNFIGFEISDEWEFNYRPHKKV
jgi:site-specific DNA-methyltransferase (adenine-specific)